MASEVDYLKLEVRMLRQSFIASGGVETVIAIDKEMARVKEAECQRKMTAGEPLDEPF
jgi:hypothetical protein